MITSATNFYLQLYRHYKNGILPYDKGLMNQPKIYLDIMSILDSRLN